MFPADDTKNEDLPVVVGAGKRAHLAERLAGFVVPLGDEVQLTGEGLKNKDPVLKVLSGSSLSDIVDSCASIAEITGLYAVRLKSKVEYIDRCAAIAGKAQVFERLGASKGAGIFKYESLYYFSLCLGNGKAASVEKAVDAAKSLGALGIPCWSEKGKLLEKELAQNLGSQEIKERR